MFFLKIFLLFFIPANIGLLFLLCNDFHKKLGNYFTLLISYGMVPLLNGLIFYYLLWFFPKNNELFYVALIFLFWTGIFLYSRKKMREIRLLYSEIFTQIKKEATKLEVVIYCILFFFTLLFSIQALIYPISEGDSAYYFLQTEALNQSKDIHWYTNSIFLHGMNEYFHNAMIRPGVPSSVAFLSIFDHGKTSQGMFKFFFVYYYYLLLGMFLLVISRLSLEVKKNQKLSRVFALLFFVFYWNMTRFYIFDNKEVTIFFFTLAGMYLVYDLVLLKKRDFKGELLLGTILGLNAFINLHGILIVIFSLVTLFIFSKLPFWQRVLQGLFVFAVHLFFSCFEIMLSFGFIFWNTVVNMFQHDTQGIQSTQVIQGNQDGKSLEALHFKMYQTPNLLSVYLKGKLQMITNPVSYGFYLLAFFVIIITKFKEIISSNFGRLLLFFIAIYYFIIIDPLNFNKNNLAVVLWGSPKYAMLIVLFSLIFVAVYFESTVKTIFNFLFRKRLFFLSVFISCFALLTIFKNFFLVFGLKLLANLIQITRGISFYVNKVEMAYYGLLGALILLIFIVLCLNRIKKSITYRIFLVAFSLFMIMPFFIADPGKVPLSKTFNYVNASEEIKLKNVIYFGDLFKVYYYAKNNIPKKTSVRTSYLEVYPHNDYFQLSGMGGQNIDVRYEITSNCSGNIELFKAGGYCLCQNIPHL